MTGNDTNAIDEKPIRHAIINLDSYSYLTLGGMIYDNLEEKISGNIQKTVEDTVKNISSGLLRGGRYSSDFSRMVDKSISEAINSPNFHIHEKEISRIYEKNRELNNRLLSIKSSAHQILEVFNQIKMDGSPMQISMIIKFISELARADGEKNE